MTNRCFYAWLDPCLPPIHFSALTWEGTGSGALEKDHYVVRWDGRLSGALGKDYCVML